ncbi:hypothetical protein [Amycolatopsis sp. cmx-4-61]|uniref:hypothetical protein n=1 Tax=Amycolatopsis sp. cmx-4-61 TaxID=2790937 RepID=UPI00397D5BC1
MVKSCGGQKKATIYAKNSGAGELSASISGSLASWTNVTVSGITVTNGSVQVGVFSDANAGNWVNVDDFNLVQTG